MKKRYITITDILFINLIVLVGVRWFSTAAKYGAGSVILWVLAAFLLFIPISLICAEFSSVFPNNKGGMFEWIGEILGKKAAFCSSWLYYVGFYFYYPSLLTFAAVCFAYSFNPQLAENKVFITIFVIVAYWVTVFFTMLGSKGTSVISKFGGCCGNIMPIFVILILGGIWIFYLKKPIQTNFSPSQWIPHFNSSNFMFLSTLALAMAGAELTSPFASEMEKPAKNYPKAILLSAVAVGGAYILGTLSLSLVISPDKVGAASGILDDIRAVTMDAGFPLIGLIVFFLMFLAGIAQSTVVTLATLKMFIEGNGKSTLPDFFTRTNKNNVPVNTLLIQASVITVVVLITSVLRSVELIYAVLVLLTTILMFLPYFYLLTAYGKMKFGKQKYEHSFKVPWGAFGAILAILLAFFTSCVTVLAPILSPDPNESIVIYELIMIGGPLVFFLIGLFLYRFSVRKKKV